MEKTVCVTGAGGFIASWLVAKLLERGYRVHGTVRNPDDDNKNGHLKKLPGAKERLTLFKADILDLESLVAAIRGCACVFHTACPVSPKFENPQDVLGPGIQGTQNVLSACHKEGIKHVVFTSSAAALLADPKRGKDEVVDESWWSDIEYMKQTEQWYRLAKTQSEQLAWNLAKKCDIKVVVICPVFVLGPLLQSTLNASSLIIARLADGSKDSYPNTDYPVVDVRDVAEAHVLAYEHPAAEGRYLCVERSIACKDMVETMKKLFPELPCPTRCDDETTAGFEIPKLSNAKTLGLIKEFIPFEKSLVDTVTSLREQGFLSSK